MKIKVTFDKQEVEDIMKEAYIKSFGKPDEGYELVVYDSYFGTEITCQEAEVPELETPLSADEAEEPPTIKDTDLF